MLSNSTVLPWLSASSPVGGAMLMASRRKSRRLVPNRKSASSAASSAFCRSFNRLAASPRSRERTVSDSLSVVSADLSLVAVGVVSAFSPVSSAWLEEDAMAGRDVFRESDRVRFMMDSRRSVNPRVASCPTAESSCWASR